MRVPALATSGRDFDGSHNGLIARNSGFAFLPAMPYLGPKSAVSSSTNSAGIGVCLPLRRTQRDILLPNIVAANTGRFCNFDGDRSAAAYVNILRCVNKLLPILCP
jgi:hypothetical protein